MLSITDNSEPIEQTKQILADSYTHVLADPELARLAVAVYMVGLLRLWLIGRELSCTRHGGAGWIDQAALFEDLPARGWSITDRHYRRLLARGDGVFWHRHADRLYLTGIARLAQELVIAAGLRGLESAILTNQPGGLKSVWLDVSGPQEQFESNIYAAWLGGKEHTTIARATLEGLWNRNQTTLRRWEQTRLEGMVIVTPGYAITRDRDRVPSDGSKYNKRSKEFIWQLPNTYKSVTRQTPHNGQRRKVQTAVNGPYLGEGADTHRIYYSSRKRLIMAIRRYPDSPARYAFIGRWRGINFFLPAVDSNARL